MCVFMKYLAFRLKTKTSNVSAIKIQNSLVGPDFVDEPNGTPDIHRIRFIQHVATYSAA